MPACLLTVIGLMEDGVTTSHQRTDVLLTSAQAGALLGKSPKTVIRMAERGDLPIAQKLPGPHGQYLFEASVVQQKALEQVHERERDREAGTLFESEGGVQS